jgi:hypothetical protein
MFAPGIALIITLAFAGRPAAGHAAAEVVAWGRYEDGFYSGLIPVTVPNGLSNLVAIAGGNHNLALTAGGRVMAWGANSYGQADVPGALSNVVAIAAGSTHSLALTMEGQVVAWGKVYDGANYVPAIVPRGLSNVVAITAGGDNSMGLTADGQVVAWDGNFSQAYVPAGLSNVVAIAAGPSYALALTAGGRVVAWGDNFLGQTAVPLGLSNMVAIAAGSGHSLALRDDGGVVVWGSYSDPFGHPHPAVSPGLSDVVAIAAGSLHALALTAGGQVVAWGANFFSFGPTAVPLGLSNTVAIAAGDWDSLALIGLPPGVAKPAWIGPRLLIAFTHRPFHHQVVAKNGVTSYGAAGLPPGLVLEPRTGLITGQPTQAGTYSVVLSATNSLGSDSWTVRLFVNPSAGTVPIVLSGTSLGANDGRFGFSLTGPAQKSVVVEASTDLVSWLPIWTNAFAGTLSFSDPQTNFHSNRFYRAYIP